MLAGNNFSRDHPSPHGSEAWRYRKIQRDQPLEVGDFGKLIKGEHFALAARTSRKLVIAYEFP